LQSAKYYSPFFRDLISVPEDKATAIDLAANFPKSETAINGFAREQIDLDEFVDQAG
jgi:hypothetical protein